MFSVLALNLVERAFNTALSTDPATQQQLRTHLDGRCLRIVSQSPQLSVDMRFDNGKIRLEPTALGMSDQPVYTVFEQRPYDKQHAVQPADCTLSVTHLVELTRFIDDDFAGSVPVSGDMRVLRQLKTILAQTDIHLGNVLQPLLGASISGQLQRAWAKMQAHTRKRSAQAARYHTEWLKEDNTLLASRWQMQQLTTDIRSLRTDIEREHAKLDKLLAAQIHC